MASHITGIEDEVIKRRLLIDGDGLGDDRRILTLMRSFVTFATSKDMDAAQRADAHRRLLVQVGQIMTSFQRTAETITVNEDTKNSFVDLQSSLRSEIEETKTAIVEYKGLLQDATLHRKHAMEYDALAHLITAQPDRKATEEKKIDLEDQLEVLKLRRQALTQRLEGRKKNAAALLATIENLEALMREEEEIVIPPSMLKSRKDREKDRRIEAMEVDKDKNQPAPMEIDTPPVPSSSGKDDTEKAKTEKLHEDLSDSDGEQAP